MLWPEIQTAISEGNHVLRPGCYKCILNTCSKTANGGIGNGRTEVLYTPNTHYIKKIPYHILCRDKSGG